MESKTLLCIAGGITLGVLVPVVIDRIRKKYLKDNWKNHIDDGLIQVCVYSTEHLNTLGRIEKRTVYVNDLSSFFGGNDFVLDKVHTAALRTTDDIPFVPVYLSHSDRWHIMNICLNRVSAIFGSYHVFFNEARRCKSYYRSAWYLMSLSFTQNTHRGRFFVTPYKPVLSEVDIGVKRLRVDLVNESEMREICAASIVPPDWGFFNNRHKHRWDLLEKMAVLFENQLVIIADESVPVHPSSPGVRRGTSQDLHLLDGFSGDPDSPRSSSEEESVLRRTSSTTNPRDLAKQASRIARHHEDKETDNCILRVHIPFPASMMDPAEIYSKDVVLFE